VDLNDNLFTPGDTVCFFYAAKNASAVETYAFGSSLQTTSGDREEAAANPSEFTILPAGGYNRGGDILYVDGLDGRGGQPYWDLAFASLGLAELVDRYDVRGPSSAVSNRPAGRVKNPTAQLNGPYHVLLWDTGDLSVGLGDGTGSPEKTDDYALLNAYLFNLNQQGGVYIGGDDVATELNGYQSGGGAEAIVFRDTWMTFSLTTGDHRPTFGISPAGTPTPSYGWMESFVIHGGCPLLNDFDVMTPVGTAMNKITYGPGSEASSNGALLGQVTNNGTDDVVVLLGGFSLIYVHDDDTDGISDRAALLRNIMTCMGHSPNLPTPAKPVAVNGLDQNYPNPFNPQTTLAFSLRERGVMTLRVYDVSGALVRTLANESFDAGAHTLLWDGRNDAGQPVSSGVYFYKMIANDFTQTRKMVLLK
jgi:hypothetical protein